MKGYYTGKRIPETYALGKSSTGNKRVGLAFEITKGESAGQRVTWYGGFGDEVRKNKKTSTEMTFEALVAAGWSNFDLDNPVFDDIESSLVLDEEEVENEETGEVRMQTSVKWVNKVAGPVLKTQLEGGERAKFANDMKAKALLFAKQRGIKSSASANGATHPNAPGSGFGPPTGGDDDIPF